MNLKTVKTYINTLIFTAVLLSILASQPGFRAYSISLFLGSLAALICMIVLHWKFWRCPHCKHHLGFSLNQSRCGRCRKPLDMEKKL